MKKNKMIALALSFGMLSSLLVFPANAAESLEQKTAQKAASLAEALTEKYGAVSVEYALMEKGKLITEGNAGVYSKSENRALTPNTMYGIGSVSKMFVSTAAMMLVEEGKLNLDQPVYQILPEFKMDDARYQKITTRMLLNHSSGLYGSTFKNGFLYDESLSSGHDDLLKNLRTQKLKDEPGAFSVYCNDGFALAELVIEKIVQKSFTEFVHEKITGSMGMNNTKTPADDFDRKEVARAYDGITGVELPGETLNMIGTGGIYSTAGDLCRFGQIFNGETKLLSAGSIDQMAEDQTKNAMYNPKSTGSMLFGLGWDNVKVYPFDQYDVEALTKGGDTTTMHGSMIVLPEYDMTAAVLVSGQASSGHAQMMATEMLLTALEAQGKITKKNLPTSFEEKPAVKEIPAEVKEKMGFYANFNSMMKLSITDKNTLEMSFPYYGEAAKMEYRYIGDGFFADEKNKERIKLIEEKNGETYLWIQQYAELPEFGSTVTSLYMAQKLKKNELSEETIKAWAARQGKSYLLVNERYNSISYGQMIPAAGIVMIPDLQGYLVGNKIVDANTSVNILRIPTVGSRDVLDYRFEQKDGVEYLLTSAGLRFMDLAAVKPVFDGEKSICTIQKEGYTRWYTVPDTAADLVMRVNVPKDAGFAVYNAQGICVENSAKSGRHEVLLPKGGYLAFNGESGAKFVIELTSAEKQAA